MEDTAAGWDPAGPCCAGGDQHAPIPSFRATSRASRSCGSPKRRSFLRRLPLPLAALLVAACSTPHYYPPTAPNTGRRKPPPEQDFRPADLAKSDIDVAAEVHLQESLASSRLIMEKLYRRNPREWRRGGQASMDAALDRAFDPRFEFRFAELGKLRGTDAIMLAFKPDYAGDRVFAFGVGLASMILLSYNGKTEFYLVDSLDAQKLYNSARNVEIAAWKLSNARDPNGQLFLLSNEMNGDVANLSFEREFGKIVAYQDVMARITAQRTNRTIRRVTQTLATAVFLPL
jgi:hypothetical protein